ncbi:MAG TPA: GNAT family N-acetyltransferase [Stellaceae bacterium]|nr:GNAT family N-acetyltransferase [Stellaceae bacterium]
MTEGVTEDITGMVHVAELPADAIPSALPDLAGILHACVLGGAGIGFVLPFSLDEANRFWSGLLPHFQSGDRRLLVARWEGRIVGTVQLVVGMPPNGRHRADIAKLLVHPEIRRRGVAHALMLAAESLARQAERSLLILDTELGSAAEPLYRSLGFAVTGVVPRYACSTAGVPTPAIFMHKLL